MKLKLYMILTLCTLLFCGCATDAPLEKTVDISSGLQTSAYPEKSTGLPIRFSERSMDEFSFEAFCYELKDGETIRYRGEILDYEIRSKLWEIICMQEESEVFEGGRSDSSTNLVLTDKKTNTKYYVGYSIWYANPEDEGGPNCFLVAGSDGVYVRYAAIEYTDEMLFVSDVYKNLLMQGVKKPENIVNDTSFLIQEESSDTSEHTVINARPVFVYIFTRNHGLFSTSTGTLIDSLGYEYSFMPDELYQYGSADMDTGEILLYMHQNGLLTQTGKVNVNTIRSSIKHARKIDKNVGYDYHEGIISDIYRKLNMFSRSYLHFFDEKTSELILLEENDKYLDDTNAKIMMRYYDYTQGNYYTYDGIPSLIKDLKWLLY